MRERDGVHRRAARGDEDRLVGFDADGAALPVFDGDVLSRDAGETRDDARVAHAFVDEAEHFFVGGGVLSVSELDDPLFVLLVPGAEVQVDEQGRLLRHVACDGRAHADAVADEVAIGETGFREGLEQTVGVGADFVGGAFFEVVGEDFLVTALLGGEMALEDASQEWGDFHAGFSEFPFVDGQDVEALVHEEDQIEVKQLGSSEDTTGVFRRLQRDGESLSEPEDGGNVRDVSDDIDRCSRVRIIERAFLDQISDVGAEPLRDIRLEAFFEENFVKEIGAFVMSSLLVPTDHEVVSISTIPDGSLVHDTEVVTIFEDLLASLLRVDANDLRCVCGRFLQIVLLNHAIAFENLPCRFGCIEWQQSICRSASEFSWKPREQKIGQHASI